MAKRRIRLNLFDPDSLADAIREMQTVAKNVPKCANDALNELADVGAQYAKNRVLAMDAIMTGDLYGFISAVHATEQVKMSKVVAPTPYAEYVEYGTGIVGASRSHPEPDGWAYDVNEHGEAGWWYYDDTFGYSSWHWTNGMPARPFMYQTRLYLEQQAPKITAKVFRNL